MRIKIKNLRVGDYVVPWEVTVVEVWHDPEGVWIATDDCSRGGFINDEREVEIEREWYAHD